MSGSIRGIVLDSTGQPISDAVVYIVHSIESHADISALSGDDGTFALPGLPAGRFLVRAESVGHRSAERTVRIRGGASTDLRIVLE